MSKFPVQVVGDQLCHARDGLSCSSNLSSIILEDLHQKQSSIKQDVTLMSLFFEIVAYVSRTSLLLYIAYQKELFKKRSTAACTEFLVHF